jgi:ferredoxin
MEYFVAKSGGMQMIFAVLFLFLFLLVIAVILVFLFSILLPAMKAEKIGIQHPVFSAKEINYVEKITDDEVRDLTRRAVVNSEGCDDGEQRLSYFGLKKCSILFTTYESEYYKTNRCAGFGDCAAVCHQHAITIQNGVAVVNALCDGCGKCISACPFKLISLVSSDQNSELPAKKGFKFWYSCYRILYGRSERYF